MRKLFLIICGALVWIGLSFSVASAELIKTYNFDNDVGLGAAPTASDADFTSGGTFWNTGQADGGSAANTGVWKPLVGAAGKFNALPSGEQVLWTQAGYIFGNTAISIEAGYIYTISVMVGNSQSDTRAFIPEFFVRGTDEDYNEIARYQNNDGSPVVPAEGGWAQVAFSFDSNSWAGKQLVIGMNATAGSTSGIIAFDNLTIERTAAPVPEPATMLLLGTGLIGLAGFGRKKLFKRS